MNKVRFGIQRSEFIAFYEKINSLNDISGIVKYYKKKHRGAKQVCWAAVTSNGNCVVEQMSDGKEPKGTAGIQILTQIKKQKLQNIIVIVVRYFGGIKLGKKKLSESYKIVAQNLVFKILKRAPI